MLLFWPIVVPFFTAVLCLLAWRSVEMQRGIALIGSIGLLAATCFVALEVFTNGPVAAQAGGWPAPYGITLVADGLSAVMLVLTGIVAVAIMIYGLAEIDGQIEHQGYHPLTQALLAGICGAFLTGDIFNMYVWFEVMLIATFGLLVVGGTKAQLDGAVKYVGLNLIATVAFIAGVGLLYGATGALNMADLSIRLDGRGGETAVIAAAAFLIFAFGSKAALFPVYFWLPASYHTPPVATSALFSALLTKVGVYALIRVFTLVFDVEGTSLQALLLWAGLLTMAFGALGALYQNAIRRVLGYGIITSIGYMILGLAVSTPLAIAGALFYLFQDVLVKAGLFLSAGAASRLTGSEEFDESGGIWRARPWFSLLFLIPALSLAGVPPFSGFWAKLLLVQATLEVGAFGLTLMVLLVGLLTLFAMGRIWAEVFWSAHPDGDGAITARLSAARVIPLLAMTGLIIYIGVAAGPFIGATLDISAGLINPSAYIEAVLADTTAAGTAPDAAGEIGSVAGEATVESVAGEPTGEASE